MDPQQEIFVKIRQACIDVIGKENYYDGLLPPKGTEYPFVYLAAVDFEDSYTNKTQIGGRASITIHAYSNQVDKRGSLSAILYAIKRKCWVIDSTGTFHWSVKSCNQRILPDNTTHEPLLHGILELTYDLLGG